MNEVMERNESKMKVFENVEFGKIRTILLEDEPWFVGKDVADALGYTNPRDAISKHVDSEDKLTSQIATPGQNRNMIIINESGLYSLILSSKLESAKKFKRWVTSEVLPSIRRTGTYVAKTDGELYERLDTLQQNFGIAVVQLNSVEKALDIQSDRLYAVIDNMTLTTVQQGRLQRAVKDRVNYLLGGAHSRDYKENSRQYFINLWNDLKLKFSCGSRWQDLNPMYFAEALDYINAWQYDM